MRLSHDQEGVKNIAMIENLSAWKTTPSVSLMRS